MEIDVQIIIMLVVLLVLVIYNMIMIGIYAGRNESVKSQKEKIDAQKKTIKSKYNIA